MRFEFLALDYLWFLLVIPVFIAVHLFMLNYYKGKALKFANLEAISRVIKGRAGGGFGGAINKDLFVLIRRTLILLVLVFAVTQPILYYEGQTTGFDYVVAIDNSLSMSADDLEPDRLGAAKGATSRFLSLVSGGSEVGVVSFSSTVNTVHQITRDLESVDASLNEIVLSSAGGTAIGDAVITGSNLLDGFTRSKAIILLTDGQNNVGASVNSSIEYANEKNVVVHTLGIGSDEGGLIDIGIVSTLNSEELESLSSGTGGEFFSVESVDELDEVFEELIVIDEAEIRLELGYILLLIGMVVLLVEWLFFGTFYKVVR